MNEFLTTEQAAVILGRSTSSLAHLRVSGGGPAYRKHGRSVRYTRPELEAWSNARLRTSTSQDG